MNEVIEALNELANKLNAASVEAGNTLDVVLQAEIAFPPPPHLLPMVEMVKQQLQMITNGTANMRDTANNMSAGIDQAWQSAPPPPPDATD